MVASDLQDGKTAVARGKKIVGTGKSFEFASYGVSRTNVPEFIPATINVIEITSLDYPIKSMIALNMMQDIDFSSDEYLDKYYDRQTGLWYYDAAHTQIFDTSAL